MPDASSSPHLPLLDPEAIQRTEYLGMQACTIVEGYMAGAHKSPFRGFAVEFAQHREYVPGDDTRHLDWKVLGRSERYYIKQYEQETNFVAHLLLDGSESMRYGSGAVRTPHPSELFGEDWALGLRPETTASEPPVPTPAPAPVD